MDYTNICIDSFDMGNILCRILEKKRSSFFYSIWSRKW